MEGGKRGEKPSGIKCKRKEKMSEALCVCVLEVSCKWRNGKVKTPEMHRKSDGKADTSVTRRRRQLLGWKNGLMCTREGESYEEMGEGDHLSSEI